MELYKDSIPLEKSKKNILLRDDGNLEKVTFFLTEQCNVGLHYNLNETL